MNFNINTSGFPVLFFALGVLIIYLVFRFLNKYTRSANISSRQQKFLQKNLPISELLIWIVFLAWSIDFFLFRNDVFAGALVIVFIFALFWISRYSLKNLISGFMFRSSFGFYLNDYIKVNDLSGKIVYLGYLFLEIENKSGLHMQIPYSELEDKVRIKKASQDFASGYSFQMKIPIKVDFKDAKLKIEQAITNSPFSAINHWPNVEIIRQEDKIQVLQITVYALDKKFHAELENKVREMNLSSL